MFGEKEKVKRNNVRKIQNFKYKNNKKGGHQK